MAVILFIFKYFKYKNTIKYIKLYIIWLINKLIYNFIGIFMYLNIIKTVKNW